MNLYPIITKMFPNCLPDKASDLDLNVNSCILQRN